MNSEKNTELEVVKITIPTGEDESLVKGWCHHCEGGSEGVYG
ncbi:MAG: hypothetical protein RR523_12365 [Cetobacterium sp.]